MRYFIVLYDYATLNASHKGSGDQPFTAEGFLNRVKIGKAIGASVSNFLSKKANVFFSPEEFSININQILEVTEGDFNDWTAE